MVAYYIIYSLRNDDKTREISIDAKNLKSAKRKIGKKHKYKDGRMIKILKAETIGYF